MKDFKVPETSNIFWAMFKSLLIVVFITCIETQGQENLDAQQEYEPYRRLPQLLLTIKTRPDSFNLASLDPNPVPEKLEFLTTDTSKFQQNHPVSIGSAATNTFCYKTSKLFCFSSANNLILPLDLPIGVADSPLSFRSPSHFEINPYDGAHVMYLEPNRQSVWIVNLRKSKAKLIGLFDNQNLVSFNVDWAHGILFTVNASTISANGIQPNKLQPLFNFEVNNASYLACDPTLQILYWTDVAGSVFKRYYDQPHIETVYENACMRIVDHVTSKPFYPVYVHNTSVICIKNFEDSEQLTLRRYNLDGGWELFTAVTFRAAQILNSNIFPEVDNQTLIEQVAEICDRCSHLCVPVNNAKYECACAHGLELIDQHKCEDFPAVLAIVEKLPTSEHLLLLRDFMTVPPSTWTYSNESSAFRIVLSDTFRQLCLHFSSNNSVECFSPFGGFSRKTVWTSMPEDNVIKVTDNSMFGFHIVYYRNGCVRVHQTVQNTSYTLDCRLTAFIDHLEWKLYFFNSDGILEVQDPETEDYTSFKNQTLNRNSVFIDDKRPLYVDVKTQTALFLTGMDGQLRYLFLQNKTSIQRSVGPGRSLRQALIYEKYLFWADDLNRIVIMNRKQMAAFDVISVHGSKDFEFSVLEKVSIQNPEKPDPCQSQTECRNLCKTDKNILEGYTCWCPLYSSFSVAETCQRTKFHIGLTKNGKFNIYEGSVGGFGKDLQLLPFQSKLEFENVATYEPQLRRMCTSKCPNRKCGITCMYQEHRAEVFETEATDILSMVEPQPPKSDALFWISDETERETNKLCLNVGTPKKLNSSLQLNCFRETINLQNPHYILFSKTLFWQVTKSNRCFIRSVNNVQFDDFVTEVTDFPGECFGLDVALEVSRIYVLTADGVFEYDWSKTSSKELYKTDFDPTTNLFRVFNQLMLVGTKSEGFPAVMGLLPGATKGVATEFRVYWMSKSYRLDILRIIPPGVALDSENRTFDVCDPCRFYCVSDKGTQNTPQCLCPLPPGVAPPYGPQFSACLPGSLEAEPVLVDSGPSSKKAGILPPLTDTSSTWVFVFFTVSVVLSIAGICHFVLWRRMKRRQDLRLQQAVENFIDGNNTEAATAENENERALHLPFTSIIPPAELKITDACLGEGNFGQVLKGEYNGRQVAVKMIKDSSDPQVVQEFLKELKIMAYVGKHENIVEFFGAEVSEIRKGLLRVVLELCDPGSLSSILEGFESIETAEYELVETAEKMSEQQTILEVNNSLINDNQSGYKIWPIQSLPIAPKPKKKISVRQLCKWAQQIASGMHYLEQKNVVHGDLAARNILISDGFTAKISDFGFSKNMYKSKTYRKRNDCSLPWRWASPETLSRLEFSFKADVWSYGVTVWEIFSLGDVPFINQDWEKTFLARLKEGMRLPQPEKMPLELYQEILLPCWNLLPRDRPSFGSLVDQWSSILEEN